MAKKTEVARLDQLPQMQLQCVPIDLRECQRGRKCHAAMLSCDLEQLFIDRGQRSHQSFALDLLFEGILLLLETQQKETHPVDEAGFIFVQRSLSAAKRAIVLFPIFLDNALE